MMCSSLRIGLDSLLPRGDPGMILRIGMKDTNQLLIQACTLSKPALCRGISLEYGLSLGRKPVVELYGTNALL